jgi:hypothetical protein
MTKYLTHGLIFSAFLITAFLPLASHAFTLIPCGNSKDASGKTQDPIAISNDCDFNDFIKLGQNVMNALIFISIPIATIAFTYVGIVLLTAQGNTGKIQKAKDVAWNVGIGFIFVLFAWLIVNTFMALVNKDFNRFIK